MREIKLSYLRKIIKEHLELQENKEANDEYIGNSFNENKEPIEKVEESFLNEDEAPIEEAKSKDYEFENVFSDVENNPEVGISPERNTAMISARIGDKVFYIDKYSGDTIIGRFMDIVGKSQAKIKQFGTGEIHFAPMTWLKKYTGEGK